MFSFTKHGWFTVLLSIAGAAGAGSGADGFRDVPVVTGLSFPTHAAFSPDGRLFIAEKRGVVLELDGLDDPTATVVVDLRTETHNIRDRGLLAMALHPDFPDEPSLYTLLTADALPGGEAPHWGEPGADTDPCPDPPGILSAGCVVTGRLSRFVLSPGRQASEQVLLSGEWCQQFPSHSVGDLGFDASGALIVSAGDGARWNVTDVGQLGHGYWGGDPCGDPKGEGGALRSQDLRTPADPVGLNGSVLRLDPISGNPLPDNPLVGNGVPGDDAIVAFGLRQPFRFATRPSDDSVWIAEVGARSFEEINWIPDTSDGVVENFGWPCFEGSTTHGLYVDTPLCLDLLADPDRVGVLTPPFLQLPRNELPGPARCQGQWAALSGAAFVEGESYPAAYRGALAVSEVGGGCLWVVPLDGRGNPDPGQLFTFPFDLETPVDLLSGPEGDLFYVNHLGGSVHRLVADPSVLFLDGFEAGDASRWSEIVNLQGRSIGHAR